MDTYETFVLSDTHMCHDKPFIHGARGFSSVEEHDETIIRRWNETVTNPNDVVWVLGDYALGDRARGLGYLSRLTGRKRLIIGNHDRCFSAGSSVTGHDYVAEYMDAGFEIVLPWTMIRLPAVRKNQGGRKVLLSHFPYDGDHTGVDRHAQARLRDEGSILVHGHTHGTYTLSRSSQGTLQVHVGVDSHASQGAPINLRTVAQWVEDVETKTVKVPKDSVLSWSTDTNRFIPDNTRN